MQSFSGPGVRKTTNIELFGILTVTLLPAAYARYVFRQRLHIELDCSITKRQFIESKVS
jgi:hypothetical protein